LTKEIQFALAAHHAPNLPDDVVVGNFVVAEPAREPFAATVGLQFGTPLVVFAAKNAMFLVLREGVRGPERQKAVPEPRFPRNNTHVKRLLFVFVRDDRVVDCVALLENVGDVFRVALSLAVVPGRHQFLAVESV
jgi:hypothetical protein